MSEGVGMEVLGVRVVRISFFGVTDACLSLNLPQSQTGIQAFGSEVGRKAGALSLAGLSTPAGRGNAGL